MRVEGIVVAPAPALFFVVGGPHARGKGVRRASITPFRYYWGVGGCLILTGDVKDQIDLMDSELGFQNCRRLEACENDVEKRKYVKMSIKRCQNVLLG
ncbi:hypothetical protein CEXT_510651 [Caerostris extrusa]|uniref:Uncharacterized protein n=1 Tax=Caerostris extrusa TaxID=172846 RepID=A0AAV4Q767_CAEEX|nr:hypothetical protein CEXT_510651 [Caerostris extrusa]